MKNKILLIITLILLQSCYSAPKAIKPASFIFDHMPKNASYEFKEGWKDGCESGLANMTNTAYKTFYQFKQNAGLRSNPEYYKAWKDTYNYCRHYAYGIIRQSDQRMNLPNARSAFMTSFLGTEGIFEVGPLNMWGPGGKALPFLNNMGPVAGDPYIGQSGVLDFSDDMLFNGKQEMGTWNFGY